jgi:eukaryotic-like serine/threonine-protein kinase
MSDHPQDGVPPVEPDATKPQPESHHPSRTIGPYRLLQRVGEGGMGEVWLAEQTHPVRRQVALKVIKAGMDTAQVVTRFEAERQALAMMDHPAIATVYDGGSTPEGRPYFAMEYVKGEPITAYCDRQRLTMQARLELFMQVCEGVQHAHQKGIIHRDLKPSNVLVTIQGDHPVPKIIDFGVAKATAQHLTERTLYTELGVMIGTPEYMSPEQAEMGGLDIDTRTDVYALGVILYELLTGALPFDRKELRQAGFAEIQRTIREKEPPRPSTRITELGSASTEAAANRHTEPRRLASELRGDLDWVTMKALEKDRTRRYQTANALAADVLHHLSNEPVSAGPPSTVYRVGKFVRRHRFGVTAAATLVLLLVAFGVTMALQAQRIARERDRANREAETARRVSEFLVGLFEVSKPSEKTANSITAREILDAGAERIRTELQAQPLIRSALLSTMGDVYLSVGLYGKALELYTEARELERTLSGPSSARTAKALLNVARALASQGRFAEAEPLFLESLSIRRTLYGNEHLDVAEGQYLLGLGLEKGKADYAQAETLIRESLRVRRKLLGESNAIVARTLRGLGVLLLNKGEWAEAERIHRQALAIDLKVLGPSHPNTVGDRDNVATALLWQGNYAGAEVVYRQSLEEGLRTFGPVHPELVYSYTNLGAALYFQRKYHEAEAQYRKGVEVARKALGNEHPQLASAMADLGQSLDALQQYDEADKLYEESLKIQRQSLGDENPRVALTLVWSSITLRHMKRFTDAEVRARKAVGIDRQKLGETNTRTLEAEGALGAILAAERKWQEAEPLLVGYADALERKRGVEGDLTDVVQQIVDMYTTWGKPDKAAEWRAKLAKPAAPAPTK